MVTSLLYDNNYQVLGISLLRQSQPPKTRAQDGEKRDGLPVNLSGGNLRGTT
jgi:hypothetical protein